MLSIRRLRLGFLYVGVLLLAACSSAARPASSPTPSSTDTYAYAASLEVPLVQCFIDHNLLPGDTYDKQSWYHAGKVTGDAAFANWWKFMEGMVVDGKQLDVWTHDAAFSNQWPTSLCGPEPSPSAG
jgi:hypothetical protein